MNSLVVSTNVRLLKICTYCLLSHFVTKITIKKFLSDFRDKLCMKIHAKCIMHIATVLFQREINLLVATTRLFLDCYKRSGTTTYDSISFSFRNALNKKAMRRRRVKGVRKKIRVALGNDHFFPSSLSPKTSP